MTLPTGETLQNGRYQIREQLGQGGMGTVFLAADRNLSGHLVAIKQNITLAPHAQKQFEREAVLLARLRHPNLPRVLDHFIEAGRQYLVMDYIRGEDLRSSPRPNRVPPEAEVLAWIAQVMAGLDYMHNWVDPDTKQVTPIIHRDIKPANIKRTADGQLFLVDFGLAKIVDGFSTLPGGRGYTPGYSPIEQYSGITDQRSDIYALGATLYTLLTGHRPPESTLIAANNTLHPPRYYNPQIKRATEQVIMRALSSQAANRYAIVAEMYQALFGHTLPAAAQRAAKNQRTGKAFATPTTRRHWHGSWVALVSVPLLFVLILTLRQGIVNRLLPHDLPIYSASNTATLTETPVVVSTSTGDSVANNLARDSSNTVVNTEISTATDTFVGVSTPTSVETLISQTTPTPSEAPTSVAELAIMPTPTRASVTPTRGAVATATISQNDTIAVVAESAPTFTQFPTPTRASRSTATAIAVATATPDFTNATVMLVEPNDGDTINNRRRFAWQSSFDLLAGYYFEPVFWRPGGNALADGEGIGGPTESHSMDLQPDQFFRGPGDYYWGVLLVTLNPYERVQQLGGERRLRVEFSSISKGSSCTRTNSAGQCID